ncbi:general transcription factor II-I repeat domain-containing protein 2A-like [Diabrotica virgifera virgifera]|uniref:Uncharacterized protein n=1 Tax=Diabrotica virgifera virgifera TaxID=50390 RepID=A0ABM5KXK1_DIAVI|nr:general transcription factor II-I repeat domain-containing protein 2A-like [Diabrotica virgifera virgifera]
MDEIMKMATKIVNSIRARSLQQRLFKAQLEARDSEEHTDLLLLLPEIISFLEEQGDDTYILQNEKWLSNLAFLSDLTNHLNVLNLELQGKNKTIIDMMSAVHSFVNKLKLLIKQINRKDLDNFPSLKKGVTAHLNYVYYETELQVLQSEFERRFADFKKLTDIVTSMSNPFSCEDVEKIATEISVTFNMEIISVQNEVLKIISDIHLTSRATDTKFWSFISSEKYLSLKQVALQLTASLDQRTCVSLYFLK